MVEPPGRLRQAIGPDPVMFKNSSGVFRAPAAGRSGSADRWRPGTRSVQSHRRHYGGLLREYCGEKRCTVELVDRNRGAPRTLSFAIRGGILDTGTASTTSTIAATRDGGTLVFFRRGLDAVIVETATDRRQSLADLAGLPRDVVGVAFAPSGKRMAVAGYPLPWQVSILERP